VTQLGVDPALTQAFTSMAARYLPARAKGERALIQWEIDTPEGKKVHCINVDGATCTHTPGAATNPRVTIGVSVANFLRLIAGRLNGLQAYSNGDLRMSGDTVIAQLQQMWFDVDLREAKIDISTPSQLRKLLGGRADAEIEAGVLITGTDNALDKVFQGMVDHFLPEKAGKKRVVIQFSVRTQDGDKTYYLSIDNGACSYSRGQHRDPNVTLMIRLPNFMRLIAGELDGIMALMQGHLKVKGNILLARSLQSWFDQRA
jgi:putative sterol carrier protein